MYDIVEKIVFKKSKQSLNGTNLLIVEERVESATCSAFRLEVKQRIYDVEGTELSYVTAQQTVLTPRSKV